MPNNCYVVVTNTVLQILCPGIRYLMVYLFPCPDTEALFNSSAARQFKCVNRVA